jgi:Flp pilus assembly protein CpaB
VIAVAAVLLAAVAGISVYLYVSGADRRAEEKVQLVDALVAARDIPKGTSGASALADGSIVASKVLRGSVPLSAVTDPEQLSGKVASSTIQARQFITDATFLAPSEGGGGTLAAAIAAKDKVAVTISVDTARAVATQIAPGDRVDVAVVGGDGTATVLLPDAKVLAVGQDTAATAAGGNGQPSAGAASSGLITFELSQPDALALIGANRSSLIYLILKPLGAIPGSGSSSVPAGR